MKRIAAIALLFLILFTGINVKIASHFCGGNFSGIKVSLTGELASCGMESQSGTKPSEDLLSRHCCDDLLFSVSINTNYVPSSCHYITVAGQDINQTFIIQDQTFIAQSILYSAVSGSKRPPGGFNPSDVEQQVICIFQI